MSLFGSFSQGSPGNGNHPSPPLQRKSPRFSPPVAAAAGHRVYDEEDDDDDERFGSSGDNDEDNDDYGNGNGGGYGSNGGGNCKGGRFSGGVLHYFIVTLFTPTCNLCNLDYNLGASPLNSLNLISHLTRSCPDIRHLS